MTPCSSYDYGIALIEFVLKNSKKGNTMKFKLDPNYLGMGRQLTSKDVRSHETNFTNFQYPDEDSLDVNQKMYTSEDFRYLLRELFQLKMQDFFILQQKYFHPEKSYSEIGKELGVSKQAIQQRIKRIMNDAIFCFICRDHTFDKISKNSLKF